MRARSAWSICACSGADVFRSTRSSRLASARFWSAPTVLIWPGGEYQARRRVLRMVPCSVVELRQYTLHPGQRDALVSLFERELIEPQEAAGIRVLGQFEDLDRPDRFVWFRGFAGMAGRHAALTAFYGGPVWAEHRDAANATMVDSDDVLLLRPARASAVDAISFAAVPPPANNSADRGIVLAGVHLLRVPASEEVLRFVEGELP